jgi:peptidyl-prolyl cis-trans isomerase D
MLSLLRRFANTWVAKLFFVVLVGSFGIWGVGDVVRNLATRTWAAKVAGATIEPPQLEEAYRRQLQQFTRMLAGRDVSPEMRRLALSQSLDQLMLQTALNQEVDRLGLVVPDAALREAVLAMPGFRGKNGAFDRSTFEAALRENNYTEARFMQLMRADLGQRQVLAPVRASAASSDTLARRIFAFEQQKRTADMVEFPVASQPAPAPPSEDTLRRWWDNHPDSYSTPELRRIKVAILAPETLAKGVEVPEEDLRAAYEQRKAEFQSPERRSAEVISAPDEATAHRLAAAWRGGADWTKMQEEAKAAGATAIALDDATGAEFPAAELATAVFTAPPDTVSDPVQTPLGWDVVQVTKVTPGVDRSFDDAKAELRDQLATQRAADLIDERVNKVEDALAGGAKLDELPGDLGLVGVTGTLDAKGNTKEGTPAPIPGSPELRAALIESIFRLKPGDPPHLTEVQGPNGGTGAYYAAVVEEIIPPAREPFETVRDRVLADWTADARRHAAETAAAKLYAAVKGGQSLDDAATVAGVRVDRLPAIGRQGGAESVPTQLRQPLFSMQKGEATMVETADGFAVAVLTGIEEPDPASDPIGFGRMRDELTRSLGDDYESTLVLALRDRGRPQVNQAVLDQIVQP